MSLHAGSVVYRVIEVDPPPDVQGHHTWAVAAVPVERASTQQIKLKRFFPGLSRKVFEPSAFGRVFFETPLQAIQVFLTERRLEIESIDRKKKEASRAIAWALDQEGMASAVKCLHTRTERGKDAPRVWGSCRTQVCLDCGAFRMHMHGHDEDPSSPPGWSKAAWRPVGEYEEATAEPDDD